MGLAAKRDLDPVRMGLRAYKAPEFIEFEHVALLCWQERVA